MVAPAQTYDSLAALTEGAAREEPRAPPACRLHARVRPHRQQGLAYHGPVDPLTG